MKRAEYIKRPPKMTECGYCKNKFMMNNSQKWKEAKGKASMFFCCRVCAAKWRSRQPGAKNFATSNYNIAWRPRKPRVEPNVVSTVVQSWPQVLRFRQNGNKMDAFLQMLGSGWKFGVTLPTNMQSGTGYAASYMIDIANPAMRMAIDFIDPRQERNFRKEDFLRSRGWTLLRFNKQEVEGNLNFCVKMVWTAISRLAAA